ncbi:uncharacterized protein LOC119951006 [Scyliorhinus canicula]|uniref:uncharacterized protein LOC119951006 n=1 Tax=Scyliorhinus canicula TaxID=7830 RepID=UPI0018F2F8D6|nr:uncharacterized protein LOC119951006 [Scyliorhinus canicula]
MGRGRGLGILLLVQVLTAAMVSCEGLEFSDAPPGSPLTASDYEKFFLVLRPSWKAGITCLIRRTKGCHDLKVMKLDEFENHGLIPEGPICTDFFQAPRFNSFCQFAQYRCANHMYYMKEYRKGLVTDGMGAIVLGYYFGLTSSLFLSFSFLQRIHCLPALGAETERILVPGSDVGDVIDNMVSIMMEEDASETQGGTSPRPAAAPAHPAHQALARALPDLARQFPFPTLRFHHLLPPQINDPQGAGSVNHSQEVGHRQRQHPGYANANFKANTTYSPLVEVVQPVLEKRVVVEPGQRPVTQPDIEYLILEPGEGQPNATRRQRPRPTTSPTSPPTRRHSTAATTVPGGRGKHKGTGRKSRTTTARTMPPTLRPPDTWSPRVLPTWKFETEVSSQASGNGTTSEPSSNTALSLAFEVLEPVVVEREVLMSPTGSPGSEAESEVMYVVLQPGESQGPQATQSPKPTESPGLEPQVEYVVLEPFPSSGVEAGNATQGPKLVVLEGMTDKETGSPGSQSSPQLVIVEPATTQGVQEPNTTQSPKVMILEAVLGNAVAPHGLESYVQLLPLELVTPQGQQAPNATTSLASNTSETPAGKGVGRPGGALEVEYVIQEPEGGQASRRPPDLRRKHLVVGESMVHEEVVVSSLGQPTLVPLIPGGAQGSNATGSPQFMLLEVPSGNNTGGNGSKPQVQLLVLEPPTDRGAQGSNATEKPQFMLLEVPSGNNTGGNGSKPQVQLLVLEPPTDRGAQGSNATEKPQFMVFEVPSGNNISQGQGPGPGTQGSTQSSRKHFKTRTPKVHGSVSTPQSGHPGSEPQVEYVILGPQTTQSAGSITTTTDAVPSMQYVLLTPGGGNGTDAPGAGSQMQYVILEPILGQPTPGSKTTGSPTPEATTPLVEYVVLEPMVNLPVQAPHPPHRSVPHRIREPVQHEGLMYPMVGTPLLQPEMAYLEPEMEQAVQPVRLLAREPAVRVREEAVLAPPLVPLPRMRFDQLARAPLLRQPEPRLERLPPALPRQVLMAPQGAGSLRSPPPARGEMVMQVPVEWRTASEQRGMPRPGPKADYQMLTPPRTQAVPMRLLQEEPHMGLLLQDKPVRPRVPLRPRLDRPLVDSLGTEEARPPPGLGLQVGDELLQARPRNTRPHGKLHGPEPSLRNHLPVPRLSFHNHRPLVDPEEPRLYRPPAPGASIPGEMQRRRSPGPQADHLVLKPQEVHHLSKPLGRRLSPSAGGGEGRASLTAEPELSHHPARPRFEGYLPTPYLQYHRQLKAGEQETVTRIPLWGREAGPHFVHRAGSPGPGSLRFRTDPNARASHIIHRAPAPGAWSSVGEAGDRSRNSRAPRALALGQAPRLLHHSPATHERQVPRPGPAPLPGGRVPPPRMEFHPRQHLPILPMEGNLLGLQAPGQVLEAYTEEPRVQYKVIVPQVERDVVVPYIEHHVAAPHVEHIVQEPHVEHKVLEPQVEHQVLEPAVEHRVAGPHVEHVVLEPAVEHRVAGPHVEHVVLEPAVEHRVAGPHVEHVVLEPAVEHRVAGPHVEHVVLEPQVEHRVGEPHVEHIVVEPPAEHQVLEPYVEHRVSGPHVEHVVLEPRVEHRVGEPHVEHIVVEPQVEHQVLEPYVEHHVAGPHVKHIVIEPLAEHQVLEPYVMHHVAGPHVKHIVLEPLAEHHVSEPHVEHVVLEPQVEHRVAEPHVEHIVAEPPAEHQVLEPYVQHRVAQPHVEHVVLEPAVEHQVLQPLIEHRVEVPHVQHVVLEPRVEHHVARPPHIEHVVLEPQVEHHVAPIQVVHRVLAPHVEHRVMPIQVVAPMQVVAPVVVRKVKPMVPEPVVVRRLIEPGPGRPLIVPSREVEVDMPVRPLTPQEVVLRPPSPQKEVVLHPLTLRKENMLPSPPQQKVVLSHPSPQKKVMFQPQTLRKEAVLPSSVPRERVMFQPQPLRKEAVLASSVPRERVMLQPLRKEAVLPSSVPWERVMFQPQTLRKEAVLPSSVPWERVMYQPLRKEAVLPSSVPRERVMFQPQTLRKEAVLPSSVPRERVMFQPQPLRKEAVLPSSVPRERVMYQPLRKEAVLPSSVPRERVMYQPLRKEAVLPSSVPRERVMFQPLRKEAVLPSSVPRERVMLQPLRKEAVLPPSVPRERVMLQPPLPRRKITNQGPLPPWAEVRLSPWLQAQEVQDERHVLQPQPIRPPRPRFHKRHPLSDSVKLAWEAAAVPSVAAYVQARPAAQPPPHLPRHHITIPPFPSDLALPRHHVTAPWLTHHVPIPNVVHHVTTSSTDDVIITVPEEPTPLHPLKTIVEETTTQSGDSSGNGSGDEETSGNGETAERKGHWNSPLLHSPFPMSGVLPQDRPPGPEVPSIVDKNVKSLLNYTIDIDKAEASSSSAATRRSQSPNPPTRHNRSLRFVRRAVAAFARSNLDAEMELGHEWQLQTLSGKPWVMQSQDMKTLLCNVVLSNACISSSVMANWMEIETNRLGFGSKVCDELGRRHAEPCPLCAFCSLKVEQCRSRRKLQRVPCTNYAKTILYLNPMVDAEHRKIGIKMGSSEEMEYDGMETYGGLSAEYWCTRLAAQGCDDSRVMAWLQLEYSSFHEGAFPDQICDNQGQVHPHYCSFKSFQCRQRVSSNDKVTRVICKDLESYHILKEQEAERNVLLWIEQYSRGSHIDIEDLPEPTTPSGQKHIQLQQWNIRGKPIIILKELPGG